MSAGKRALLLALALAAVVAAVYSPVLDAGFVWDDDHYLTRNELIRAGDGWLRFFTADAIDFYPVSNLSLWFEWRLWGLEARGYHVTNVLIHTVSALLLWRVLARLAVPGAWWAALFFAIHPINVASVAWIAERKNVLATLLALVSVRAWLARDPEEGGGRAYVLSLAAFVLAMLSKPSVVTLPVALLLIEWWRRRAVTWSDLRAAAPFFVVSALLSVVNVWFQTSHSIGTEAELVRPEGLASRIAAAGWALGYYAVRPFWPFEPAMVYPRWAVDPGQVLHWAPLALVLAVFAILWRARGRWGAAPLCAFGFQALALLPVLGFFDIYYFRYALVADHWQYWPMIGPLALAAAAGAGLAQRPGTAIGLRAVAAAAALLAAGTGWLARDQAANFESQRTLWTANVERYDDVPTAHFHLGVAFANELRISEAIAQFERTLELQPEYTEAYTNIASCQRQAGRPELALAPLAEAIRRRPELAGSYRELGLAQLSLGANAEALAALERALELGSRDALTLSAKGNVHVWLDDLPGANDAFRAALAEDPDYLDANMNLAQVLEHLNRPEEAVPLYEKALALEPRLGLAHVRLGDIHARAGRTERAIAHLRAALQLDPSNAEARAALAALGG